VAFTDQPLEFDSFDNQGDQIRLVLNDLPISDLYALDADILIADIDRAGGEFVILFDMPGVRTIRCQFGGNIIATAPGHPNATIGTFTPGTAFHLRVEIDIPGDQWEIFLDNTSVYMGGFGIPVDPRTIRITTNVTAGPPGVSAGIDNLVVDDTHTPVAVESETWGKIKSLYR
jgi:hypothetical protein